ncbi:alpha/beta fold hydrolase [Microcella sp.]|uniref:alpha/beta fold hydrolase n=1 Tax=Microcella sp. TaxID=1913979 RepID=UPI0039193BBC
MTATASQRFRAWVRRRRAPLLHIDRDTGGDGPIVVMIHGIASSSVTFQNLVPLLEPDHRCITIDILGFGKSPAPSDWDYTLAEHAAALDATIRSLKLDRPFILIGHSLGSLIATRYAARHPNGIARLVLVSPPLYLPPETIGDRVDRAGMGAYFTLYEFLRGNQDFTVRAAAALARIAPIKNVLDVTAENWVPFTRSLQNAIESQTTIADLAAVDAPVDLVYGTLDPFLAPGGLKIAERLRHVTATRVAGNDHLVRPRLAEAVAEVVRSPVHDSEPG